jgi:hypothetical protein
MFKKRKFSFYNVETNAKQLPVLRSQSLIGLAGAGAASF